VIVAPMLIAWPGVVRGGVFVGANRQPVEFTAIQPHAAASRAVVDFHALALGHEQVRRFADRTFHLSFPSNCLQ
jgi:hypothetical protein